jgi:hypothetical protein
MTVRCAVSIYCLFTRPPQDFAAGCWPARLCVRQVIRPHPRAPNAIPASFCCCRLRSWPRAVLISSLLAIRNAPYHATTTDSSAGFVLRAAIGCRSSRARVQRSRARDGSASVAVEGDRAACPPPAAAFNGDAAAVCAERKPSAVVFSQFALHTDSTATPPRQPIRAAIYARRRRCAPTLRWLALVAYPWSGAQSTECVVLGYDVNCLSWFSHKALRLVSTGTVRCSSAALRSSPPPSVPEMSPFEC